MLNIKKVSVSFVAGVLLFSGMTQAAPKKGRRVAQAVPAEELQSELNDLSRGGFSEAPLEKLYVVQDRHVDLTKSWMLLAGVGTNVNPNIYLDTNETNLTVRYNFNNTFFAQVDGAKMSSELTHSGERIYRNDGIYPDTSFVKSRYGAAAGLNLMYGKVRVTKEFVFYFDQFFTIGLGSIEQSNGLKTTKSPTITADAGLSFGLGKMASFIVGIRDNYFKEERRNSSDKIHQMVAYSGIGVTLGGKAL